MYHTVCLDWEENATLELPLQVFTTSEFPGNRFILYAEKIQSGGKNNFLNAVKDATE
jgi:hypothetical protein